MFLQEPFATPDRYDVDAALQDELARRLPPDVLASVRPKLAALGHATATTLADLSARAQAQEPELVHFDPWGRRIDEIVVSTAWKELKAFAATHGVVATGYDAALGAHRRVVQAAVLQLFSSSSAVYSCPLAMTDAAIKVLQEAEPSELRDRLLAGLLSTDPATFITSGQWMTERPGGSDVGRTETVARPTEGGGYTLHGWKWFTSATTSEMALTLARIDDGVNPPVSGSRGLSLFAVEVRRDEHRQLQGIRVERLKDKLGTRALPTAELTLDGLPATLLGQPGRGVARIATMLNITRFYNATASASGMAHAVALARDYAGRRQAFGRTLAEQPLHQRTLRDMEAEAAGALALVMELATLLGREESGTASETDLALLRGLVPIAKLTTGKQAVSVASEALEAFGGAGYVEDTGLPAMLRDAQVLPIWEGTTNVLSLDLLRAQGRDGALTAVIEALLSRLAALEARPRLEVVRAAAAALATALPRLAAEERLEGNARRVALTTGYLWQALLLAETAQTAGEAADRRFVDFVEHRLVAPGAWWS